jgi:hypothetical protein
MEYLKWLASKFDFAKICLQAKMPVSELTPEFRITRKMEWEPWRDLHVYRRLNLKVSACHKASRPPIKTI